MKKAILTTICLLFVAVAFAQGTELDPSFSAIKSFFLPSLGASALLLWTDTWKHIRTGDWEFGVFLKTKFFPFALTQVIAVAIYLLLSYMPWSQPYIEVITGSDLASYTAAVFVGAASRVVDDFLKKGEPTA